MVIKILSELGRRVDEHKENLNKEKCKKKSELKNTITEIKNPLEGINSRFKDTEEWNNYLVVMFVEITQIAGRRSNSNEDNLRDFYENIKIIFTL